MRRHIALISLAAILVLVNWSIMKKEKHLARGRVVYLELAPVDPRSLMQGDYMALDFRIGRMVYDALPRSDDPDRWRHQAQASDGYVLVKLDHRKVASYKALYVDQMLAENEMKLRYRVRNGAVKFATNAFFFQEGHTHYYQAAKFGRFRVNGNGELLLVSMYDKNLVKLEPDKNRESGS